MRDIKFRAWHVENKTMVSFDMQTVIKDQYQQAHLCELIAGTHPDGELMQFTGLQDVNGADIYEGDILTFGAVVWHEDELAFCIENGGDMSLLSNVRFLLVIGNIHENPELLETK